MDWTPSQKGAIAETAIAAAAVELGVGVYRPLMEGGRYDLIFDAGNLLRVQCKWAAKRGEVIFIQLATSRLTPAGYRRTTYSAHEVDAIAAYCLQLRKCYFLPISLVAGKSGIQLRLSPSKNNQRTGIHSAEAYELGAIAQLGERRHGMAEVVGSSPTSSTEKAAHNGRLFS
jgi:PD-(D/E)XK nuclease superfamily protein